jgi:hypothetical protein
VRRSYQKNGAKPLVHGRPCVEELVLPCSVGRGILSLNKAVIWSVDMAESELGVLTTQCLDRRIPTSELSQMKSRLGKPTETPITPKPIGNSQITRLAIERRKHNVKGR